MTNLSFERNPEPESRQGGRGRLLKERLAGRQGYILIGQKANSHNLSFPVLTIFPLDLNFI
ncbi:MAG: hypothetical protein HN862_06505 [Candidatus Scalindua sp.]|nr:hypothetical protein [Candidatus Scalindua sp.]MBT7211053.1 hypothetical protein [Candidatus Scalindua sp.]MBT7591598.1 hypothetical protein [Candidatus Scalindua sp.]